jgi:hypothetical protein
VRSVALNANDSHLQTHYCRTAIYTARIQYVIAQAKGPAAECQSDNTQAPRCSILNKPLDKGTEAMYYMSVMS